MEYSDVKITSQFLKEARLLKWVLLLTVVLLIIGLVSPIITLKKFVLFENTFSVLSGLLALVKEDQFFLLIVITGFSIGFPILKIAVLFRLLNLKKDHSTTLNNYLHWMHVYGKWSMLDVFVVAVMVVAVKLGAIASVEIHYGLYAFAAAVILTMIVTARVVSLTNKKTGQGNG